MLFLRCLFKEFKHDIAKYKYVRLVEIIMKFSSDLILDGVCKIEDRLFPDISQFWDG